MTTESLYNWIVKKDFPEADFWLTDKSSSATVGTVVMKYEPYLVGIKAPAVLIPDYARYLCEYLHVSKTWAPLAKGATGLQHLRLSDIRRVFNQTGRDLKAQHEGRFQNFVPRRPADREFLFGAETDAAEPLPNAA